MEDDRQLIDDARLWTLEHRNLTRSRGANAAGAALAEYHRDLPEVVGSSADILSHLEIDAAQSRTTTRRILDSATRELAGGGKDQYDQLERSEIMRRALRDVLIQEAAGHEITRRGGVDPARALDMDPDRGQGEKATQTLRRQGVDVDALFGHMTEHDLAKVSHGAYNKVSLLAHPHLVKALEADDRIMTPEQEAINKRLNGSVDKAHDPEARALPNARFAVEPRRRFQPPQPARQPSFGRRVAMQAQMAGAGR